MWEPSFIVYFSNGENVKIIFGWILGTCMNNIFSNLGIPFGYLKIILATNHLMPKWMGSKENNATSFQSEQSFCAPNYQGKSTSPHLHPAASLSLQQTSQLTKWPRLLSLHPEQRNLLSLSQSIVQPQWRIWI